MTSLADTFEKQPTGTASPVEVVPVSEWHSRFRAQGAPAIEHIAFKCPICGTVQSIASLVAAGVDREAAENKYIGFSCEGRFTGAGPWHGRKADKRGMRGCDWTLGGLFRLHKIEVETPDGKRHPSFALASGDDMRALAAQFPLPAPPAQEVES